MSLSTYCPSPSFFRCCSLRLSCSSYSKAGGAGDMRPLYWLPVLFFLWANLHGQFLIGLLLLGLYVAAEVAEFLLRISGTSSLPAPAYSLAKVSAIAGLSVAQPCSTLPVSALPERVPDCLQQSAVREFPGNAGHGFPAAAGFCVDVAGDDGVSCARAAALAGFIQTQRDGDFRNACIPSPTGCVVRGLSGNCSNRRRYSGMAWRTRTAQQQPAMEMEKATGCGPRSGGVSGGDPPSPRQPGTDEPGPVEFSPSMPAISSGQTNFPAHCSTPIIGVVF